VARKKSVASVKYVVKYEFAGSPHHGTIQLSNSDRLNLETPHGSKAAALNPKSDVRAVTMVLLLEMGAKLVSLDPYSS
jgi:hypothetical protein